MPKPSMPGEFEKNVLRYPPLPNPWATNTARLEEQAKQIFELECQIHELKQKLEQLEYDIKEKFKEKT